MGLEPTTFCMASRRSSQLSYIRVAGRVYRIPATPRPSLFSRATSARAVSGARLRDESVTWTCLNAARWRVKPLQIELADLAMSGARLRDARVTEP